MRRKVVVNDRMQKGYVYYRTEPVGRNFAPERQLENVSLFGALTDHLKARLKDGQAALHAKIKMRWKDQVIDTTIGRVLFNTVLPDEVRFVNELIDKGRLSNLITKVYRICGHTRTVELLDALKTEILGGADAAYDTLVEIQQLLQNGTSGLDALLAAINNRVRFDAAQTLTVAEQLQARTNIGAVAVSDFAQIPSARRWKSISSKRPHTGPASSAAARYDILPPKSTLRSGPFSRSPVK